MPTITKIQTINGTTYDIRDAEARMYGVHYVEGPSTDTTEGTWTGTLDNLTAYYNGLTIIYVPAIAGASTTTLNLNELGAITCYYNSNTKLTTHYAVGTPILLTYVNGAWKRADYDSNTTAISNLINNGGAHVADSLVTRYQLLFSIDEDTLTPLTNADTVVATSKTMLTNVEFDAFGRFYYYTSTTNIEANGAIGAGSTAWAWNGIDLRYTFNCAKTLTANKPVYLVVTPTLNGKCKIASTTPWTHTLPSTNDGYWYILLGRTYSTYQMYMFPFHPVYKHNGTKVIQVYSDGVTLEKSVPANAVFTDTTYESKTAVSGGTDVSLVTTGEKYTWNNKGVGTVTGVKVNGTTQSPTNGIVDIGTVITDVSGKADVVSNATSGNFASLDSNGNLTDSGHKHSDYLTSHQDISGKADKADTVLTTTLSRGRDANTTVGTASFAFGNSVESSGDYSHAEGNATHAEEEASHAEGKTTYARGTASHAEGKETFAVGAYVHAEGEATIGYGQASHVGGRFNVTDTYMGWDQWQANTTYAVDDKVRILEDGKNVGYICTTANSDAEFTVENWRKDERMNYAEIIGNGANNANRSNARALTWEGDERLMGDVYIGCNADSTGGTKLEPVTATTVKTALGTTSGTSKYLREDGTWQTVSGGGGANIDDTAGAGDTDKAWSADKLTTEFGGKADKVSNATNNNLAALDSNGNLKDSGVTQAMYKGIPITVKVANISSLPATITCSAVNANHVCIWNNISSSYVQSDWKIATAAGSFTITGTKADGTISTAYFTFVDISRYYTGTVS